MSALRAWQKKSSRVVHDNPWYSVRKDAIDKGGGHRGTYYVVDTKSPAVFIVALTKKNEIVLVNQYRYPLEQFSWEVPGGAAGKEELLVAAQRELREEASLLAKDWMQVGRAPSMHGITSEIMHVFLARDLVKNDATSEADLQDLREREGLGKTRLIDAKDVLAMIAKGEINDSQSITAIVQALAYLEIVSFTKFK